MTESGLQLWKMEEECKNVGVAGYAEAFIPAQSDSQTSEWYGYFENVVSMRRVRMESWVCFFGGNIWESNPSGTGLAPHTGFEDQEAHRHLSAPSESIAEIGSFVNHSLWGRKLSLIAY